MPDDPARRSRPLIAAGALLSDAAGRIMLVRPTYKYGWDIPGGYVEQDESPLAACRREIREELGIAATIGQLLVVDWAPHPEEGDRSCTSSMVAYCRPTISTRFTLTDRTRRVRVLHGRGIGRSPGAQARASHHECRPCPPDQADSLSGAWH
jgi:ADP-ribose pyrophosphatase YjhB (NUDIX family)